MPHESPEIPAAATENSLVVTGIGAGVELSISGPHAAELHSELARLWARCTVRPAGLVGEAIAVAPAQDEDPGGLLTGITQQVTRSLIGAQTGRLLMLHAGAVSHPETGRSLVYVAEGGTGKTTLTRMLGRGYGYLTDETVAIDTEHRILPYPKPLSTRQPAGPKLEVSPDDLGLLPAPDEPTVARVVLLDRDDEHGDRPEVSELGVLDAIADLAPQSSALYALSRGLHRCAELIEATGPVLRVRYSEAESLLGLVAELIGDPA